MDTEHGSHHASPGGRVETNWIVAFLGALGLFLALYLTTLYVGHQLAGGSPPSSPAAHP